MCNTYEKNSYIGCLTYPKEMNKKMSLIWLLLFLLGEMQGTSAKGTPSVAENKREANDLEKKSEPLWVGL